MRAASRDPFPPPRALSSAVFRVKGSKYGRVDANHAVS